MTSIQKYQSDVKDWCVTCFGEAIATDKTERCYRFMEEALELVQAVGMTKDQVTQLVDYVYERDIGETHQEVGGVMVTLSTLVAANGLNLEECAQQELDRINTPEIIEKFRKKHASKPIKSPLPGSYE